MKVIVLVQQILCVVLFSNSLSLESLAMDLPSGSVLEKTLVKFCNENFASDQLLVTYFRCSVGQLGFSAFKQNEQLTGYLVAQVWMLDGQVNEQENGSLYGHFVPSAPPCTLCASFRLQKF
jgi:hypothetical protein